MKRKTKLEKSTLTLTFILLFIFFLFLLFYPSQNIIFTTPIKQYPPNVPNLNFSLPQPAPYPINTGHVDPPEITAGSYLILDVKSDVILTSKNKSERLKIASITKLMTALTALEIYQKNDVLSVKRNFNDGAVIGLETGDKMTVDALIHALLIASANDAAQVLADNAKTNFVSLMNEKTKKIHLENTLFTNVQGFDDGGNYSTVADLARLASFAMQNSYIKQIVKTTSVTVHSVNRDKSFTFDNVNQLLANHPEFQGIKTGFTAEAGECLLSFIKKNGHEVIIVVLKSEDRFGETLTLSDWAFSNFTWKNLSVPW